jgi:hypothetical protein
VRDRDRICTEYWRSRPHVVAGDGGSQHTPPPQGPLHIALLRGLFHRASRDELRALRSLLTSNSSLDESSRQQAAQVLDDEALTNLNRTDNVLTDEIFWDGTKQLGLLIPLPSCPFFAFFVSVLHDIKILPPSGGYVIRMIDTSPTDHAILFPCCFCRTSRFYFRCSF